MSGRIPPESRSRRRRSESSRINPLDLFWPIQLTLRAAGEESSRRQSRRTWCW